jgi:hypothetical protein
LSFLEVVAIGSNGVAIGSSFYDGYLIVTGGIVQSVIDGIHPANAASLD